MKLNKLILISILLIPFFIIAGEQRYAIIEANDRAFLLDTQEGGVWRYYFNNVNEQGWQQTEFSIGTYENKKYYSLTPYGEIESCPVSTKK